MIKQKSLTKRIAVLDIHSPLYLRGNEEKEAGDIGDLYLLIDEAMEAGFSAIQLLPIQDTGHYANPYMGMSLFSYNPVLAQVDIPSACEPAEYINYRKTYVARFEALVWLSAKVEVDLAQVPRQELAYAVFNVLHRKYRTKWPNWPASMRTGDLYKILRRNPELVDPVKGIIAAQSVLRQQWFDVVEYARIRGIEFIMDKPIYPVHDSAEVWANQQLFYLYPNGALQFGSGCDNPKDPFGAQYWGHAVYRFRERPDEVIDYFIEQLRFMSRLSKFIRIDHALALIWKYYLADPITKRGEHFRAIKHKLFDRLLAEFPDVYFIAEDLGYVSKRDVDAPLGEHAIPGMRCLQWSHLNKFSDLSCYPELSLAMTSNHDLESLPNWWTKLKNSRKEIFLRQLGEPLEESAEGQIAQLIKLVFSTRSMIASVSLRDLCMDRRRNNHPSFINYHDWRLRMPVNLQEVDFSIVKRIIEETKRN